MDAEQLLQEARAAANAGNRKEAREILERAVAIDPGNASAWYLLSQVVDDDQRVIECLEKVLEIDPKHLDASREMRLLKMRSQKSGGLFSFGRKKTPSP